MLNRLLFDPVMPVWLDNPVNDQRRVIKGSRNALNGAVDEGDDDERRGVNLDHNVALFYTSIGAEFGRIGIEYWVLPHPTSENKRPNRAFVNPSKPIVLTVNGQNHAEFSAALIRKDAELPFLAQRLVVHVDCNTLTPGAKRLLFVSNREDTRRGLVRRLITEEVVRALRADDELKRLNEVARHEGMKRRDETAMQQVRREVSRLLRVQGINAQQPVGAEPNGDHGEDRPTHPRIRKPRPEPLPIALSEPPTYIHFLWDDDEPIPFHSEQRRYLRIETDAHSQYHNAKNPAVSRINIIVEGAGVTCLGSTPLQGGRMRGIFEAAKGVFVGGTGTLRVELHRTGLPTLSNERSFTLVPPPPARPSGRNISIPQWRLEPVEGPDDPRWNSLGWPDSVEAVATNAQMEEGELVIYYSTAFPQYASQLQRFEHKDVGLAQSFTTRYEIWLAVHSLLMYQEEQKKDEAEEDKPPTAEETDADETRNRVERIRAAVLSAMFAAREAEQPMLATAGVAFADE